MLFRSCVANVMGINIEYAFDFISQPDGATRMQAGVELSGPAVFLINDEMKQKGMAAFTQWFEALKSESEKRFVTG